jgi:hypothetical protein
MQQKEQEVRKMKTAEKDGREWNQRAKPVTLHSLKELRGVRVTDEGLRFNWNTITEPTPRAKPRTYSSRKAKLVKNDGRIQRKPLVHPGDWYSIRDSVTRFGHPENGSAHPCVVAATRGDSVLVCPRSTKVRKPGRREMLHQADPAAGLNKGGLILGWAMRTLPINALFSAMYLGRSGNGFLNQLNKITAARLGKGGKRNGGTRNAS